MVGNENDDFDDYASTWRRICKKKEALDGEDFIFCVFDDFYVLCFLS